MVCPDSCPDRACRAEGRWAGLPWKSPTLTTVESSNPLCLSCPDGNVFPTSNTALAQPRFPRKVLTSLGFVLRGPTRQSGMTL